jgi:hypothetical protein
MQNVQFTMYDLSHSEGNDFAREKLLYDILARSPASRASIKVYCGLKDIAAEVGFIELV